MLTYFIKVLNDDIRPFVYARGFEPYSASLLNNFER